MFGGRDKLVLKRAEYLFAARAGRKRAIKRHASSSAISGFLGCASAGIPGMLMCAEEEHGPVGVEEVLRTVAVVDIPIRDQYSADSMFSLSIASCDCDIIEDAKTHSSECRRMMAGRTHNAYRILDAFLTDRIDGIQYPAGGAQGSIPRSGRDDCVACAQLMEPGHGLAFDQSDVLRPMAQANFF
jgi:hypothetical protein